MGSSRSSRSGNSSGRTTVSSRSCSRGRGSGRCDYNWQTFHLWT